jgi:amino acid transporter
MAIFNRGSHHEPHETRDEHTTGTTRTAEREHLRGEHTTTTTPGDRAVAARENAYERFGGINWGAAFFGWLVAIAVTVLLSSIIGALVAGISESTNVTQTEAEREAGTIGMAAGITLIVVLALAYYTGGYVAGRMSRFDGAKQGLGTWIMGLLLTILAVVVGWIAGDQYNVFDRVDMPRIPIPTDQATTGGVVVAVAVVLLTLFAAMLGGKVGTRYHRRVDRAHTV